MTNIAIIIDDLWINRGLGLILVLFALWLVKIGLGFIMAGQ